MLDLFVSLFFTLFMLLIGSGGVERIEQPKVATESAQFVRVVDGDTLKIRVNNSEETIRVIGINTPETVDPRKDVECFGKEASEFAGGFFASKSAQLVLTSDSSQGELDKYGRWLRYVSLDGVDYGEQALSKGFAHEYTYDEPYLYQEKYRKLEKEAEKNAAGLWSSEVCGE
jgi:micrococcal nuclease